MSYAALDSLLLRGAEWEYSVSVELWNAQANSVIDA